MSDSKIPLAGVIGAPVAHSLSPRLHGFWLSRHQIQGHYVPLHVAAADLQAAFAMLPKLGFVGVNVTIPHKEAVLNFADVVSDRAAIMGAANTIVFQSNGKLHADNTDGYGFLENLRAGAPAWDPTAGPAAIIGAGGAARAVIWALLDAGVPEIRLTNRTRARSDALRDAFGARVEVFEWVQAGNALDTAALIVNTTSLGMAGAPELRIPLDSIDSQTIVTDLVYTPLETPLLAVARDRGATVVDGLGMLLHQAVPGFERWFGERPSVDEEARAAVLAP